jgi:hypothetical protein
MKEERGKFEETVRSKLYDFESDTSAEDWEKIVAELPAGKSVRLFPLKKYWAVAAAIAALIVGGWYYFNYEPDILPSDLVSKLPKQELPKWEKVRNIAIAEQVHKDGEIAHPRLSELVSESPRQEWPKQEEVRNTAITEQVHKDGEIAQPRLSELVSESLKQELPKQEEAGNVAITEHVRNDDSKTRKDETLFMADVSSTTKRNRRWGFGMGGGRVSVSSNTGGFSGGDFAPGGEISNDPRPPEIDFPASGLITRSHYLANLNKINSDNIPYSTDIKHKKPVSLGLSVNYYMNDRWTLQSGLVYTMLRSDWLIDNLITETKDYTQRLHFLGVPLSASYRLGQWKRLGFYASAGGMVEYNIAGQLKETTLYNSEKWMESVSIKMKEPLFSVNSRLGVVYPVWRFINVYAEAGVSYYFDNGSYLKTIRSDKPFNVSLQAGFSFGF